MHTTDSRHSYQVYPNLVKGLQVEAPNRFWVADLTYVRLPEGFVYLACLLDVYSRTCIGWSLSRRVAASSSGDGIGSTTSPSRVDPSRLFGDDSTVAMCMWSACSMSEPAKVMSTPGQPTENAFAESFFKTVKWEEMYLHQYQTFEEGQACLQTFLEDVYNAKRLPSSLDYKYSSLFVSIVPGLFLVLKLLSEWQVKQCPISSGVT